MDWTGGVRRRFAAGKSNAVLQKQKAHFAKARAASQAPKGSLRSFNASHSRADNHSSTNALSRTHSGERTRSRTTRISNRASNTVDSHEIHSLDRYPQTKPAPAGSPSQSVIYINSSHPSTPMHSRPISEHDAPPPDKSQPVPTPHSNMNTEERLLLANRRRLLARNDWLGLAYVRPVQIRFQSSQGKDRIGKRRKIRSTASRKPRPAEKISNAPLFKASLSQHEHMMSGALQQTDMRIKIGTDALASQTQVSRHSHMSGKTSLAPVQSEFSHLSEESMLLGADDDIFGSTLLQGGEVEHHHEAIQLDTRQLSSIEGGQTLLQTQYVPDKAQMQSFEHFNDVRPLSGDSQSFHTHRHDWNTIVPLVEDYEAERSECCRPTPSHENLANPFRCEDKAPNEDIAGFNNGPAATQPSDDEDNEQMWKRLMGISDDSSNDSKAALKSSSMHLTDSDISHRPVLEKPQQISKTLSAPTKDKNLGIAHSGAIPLINSKGASNSTSAALNSPSASFKLLTKCARSPAVLPKDVQEEVDDDALWREFVIGSPDTSGGPSEEFESNTLKAGEDRTTLAPASSAFDISGLGTSIESTLGESDPSRKDQTQLDSDEGDSIEDIEPSARVERHEKNFHAVPTSILNPQGFKRPRKEVDSHYRRANRLDSFKRPKGGPQRRRSVYDLVDSDGLSLDG